MGGHYIPRQDGEFDIWFLNLLQYIRKKTQEGPGRWTDIPEREISALIAANEDWRTYYEPTLLPHTPAATADKNNARKRAESVISHFVQRFLQWHQVTDADRVNMRIPTREKTRAVH